MIMKTKRVLLWIPTAALVVTAFVVVIFLSTSNSQRISDLEKSQDTQVITFTFNQGINRFRIICNEDKTNPDVYVCTTIRLPNASPTTPLPTPTGGG